MANIEFVGEYTGFMFLVDEKIWEVHMNAAGYFVMMEPNLVMGKYPTWAEFEQKHPEFAATMVKVVQRKMQETVNYINEMQVRSQFPEVCQEPEAGTEGSAKADDVVGRAYQ